MGGINLFGWQVVEWGDGQGGMKADIEKAMQNEVDAWETETLDPWQQHKLSTKDWAEITDDYYQAYCLDDQAGTNPAFDMGLAFFSGGAIGGTMVGLSVMGALQGLGYEEDESFSVSHWLDSQKDHSYGDSGKLLCGLYGPYARELVTRVKNGESWEKVEQESKATNRYLAGDGPSPQHIKKLEIEKAQEKAQEKAKTKAEHDKKVAALKKKNKGGMDPLLIGAVAVILIMVLK